MKMFIALTIALVFALSVSPVMAAAADDANTTFYATSQLPTEEGTPTLTPLTNDQLADVEGQSIPFSVFALVNAAWVNQANAAMGSYYVYQSNYADVHQKIKIKKIKF